jgi:protein-S-isoprenylcysteine O-methyltransferase Ste14
MRPLLLAYVILMAFLGLERLLRRDVAARSLESGPADRGTTRSIGITYGLAINGGFVAPLLNRRGVGRLPAGIAEVGPVCMLAGLALRVWAALSLGTYYTRTLRTVEDQPVVQNGPYRLVRHRGYAGDLLMWFGFGLASGNTVVLGLLASAMGIAYARRIEAEEAMLVQRLGAAYVTYRSRTSRLVPGVF